MLRVPDQIPPFEKAVPVNEWHGPVGFSETTQRTVKHVTHKRYGLIGEIAHERGKWTFHFHVAAAKLNEGEINEMWVPVLAVIERLEMLQRITTRLS